MYSHSLIINLTAQSMAAACLVDVHPRFEAIGQKLRGEAMALIQCQPSLDSTALLALMMFGPTGNWHDARDLGLVNYRVMKNRIDAMASSGELILDETQMNSFNFFREAMVFWELLLTFVADGSEVQSCQSPIGPVLQGPRAKRLAHPWTGVARDAIQLVADVGRLVQAHRRRHKTQRFITKSYIEQLSQDLAAARELERRLLGCQHPGFDSIVHPEDELTPVWHLTHLAELYRYAGLGQLYRVFPDILAEKLASVNGDNVVPSINGLAHISNQSPDEWLTAFTIEALCLLETMPLNSGTRDFQPFLLVLFSNELVCERSSAIDMESSPDYPDINGTFAEVAVMRELVLDRLVACLRLIPPKPIRVCIDIVKETWRRIDAGQEGVYWMDVMMGKGWETIMA